jgi:hypothetical protein
MILLQCIKEIWEDYIDKYNMIYRYNMPELSILFYE